MAQGGKSFNDRVLASEVRVKGLEKIKAIFNKPESKLNADDFAFMRNLLLRLAPTLLPRLNEHTGAEGKDLFPQPIYGGESTKEN